MTGCDPQLVRSGKAKGRTSDMYGPGNSDGGILSMKRTNKGAQSRQGRDQPPAEFVEKRPPAEGNRVQTAVTSTQGPGAASIGLNRVQRSSEEGLGSTFHQSAAPHRHRATTRRLSVA